MDWSKINKKDYLGTMVKSSTDNMGLKNLLNNALTDEIDSREMFMKGIIIRIIMKKMNKYTVRGTGGY